MAAECYLVSQIGRPVREPQLVDLRLFLPGGRRPLDLAPAVEPLVRRELDRLSTFWRETLEGIAPLY